MALCWPTEYCYLTVCLQPLCHPRHNRRLLWRHWMAKRQIQCCPILIRTLQTNGLRFRERIGIGGTKNMLAATQWHEKAVRAGLMWQDEEPLVVRELAPD